MISLINKERWVDQQKCFRYWQGFGPWEHPSLIPSHYGTVERRADSLCFHRPFACCRENVHYQSSKATAQKGATTIPSYSYQLHIKAQCDGENINEADIPADKKKKHLVLIHILSHSISRSLCLALTATSMSQRGGVEIPQWTCSWFKTEIELKIPFQESPGITGRCAGLGVQGMEFFLLVPGDVNIIGK